MGKRQANRNGREFEDIVLGWVESERKAGRPDSYIALSWAALRSWLKHEESAPAWRPALKVRPGTPIQNEVVPTPQQLRMALDRTPVPRLQALLLVLASSGVRPGVLGSESRPDGLRLRHLPELKPDGPSFEGEGPFRLDVPATLSRTGNAYFTFVSREASEHVLSYLRARGARGERLTAESALFAPEPKAPQSQERRAPDGTAFLSEKALGNELRRILRKASPPGTRMRPYVLRAYFDTQLLLAESKGKVAREYRVFWMGHKGSIEARYTTNKGRLPPTLVNDMRETYRRFEKILTVEAVSEQDVRQEVVRVLLESLGYSDQDLEGVDLTDLEGVRALTQTRIARAPSRQSLVKVDDLPGFLEKGWTFVGNIGADRVLLNPPAELHSVPVRSEPAHRP